VMKYLTHLIGIRQLAIESWLGRLDSNQGSRDQNPMP
jgi:hypothetical protein